jgi:hypothetical protein
MEKRKKIEMPCKVYDVSRKSSSTELPTSSSRGLSRVHKRGLEIVMAV